MRDSGALLEPRRVQLRRAKQRDADSATRFRSTQPPGLIDHYVVSTLGPVPLFHNGGAPIYNNGPSDPYFHFNAAVIAKAEVYTNARKTFAWGTWGHIKYGQLHNLNKTTFAASTLPQYSHAYLFRIPYQTSPPTSVAQSAAPSAPAPHPHSPKQK